MLTELPWIFSGIAGFDVRSEQKLCLSLTEIVKFKNHNFALNFLFSQKFKFCWAQKKNNFFHWIHQFHYTFFHPWLVAPLAPPSYVPQYICLVCSLSRQKWLERTHLYIWAYKRLHQTISSLQASLLVGWSSRCHQIILDVRKGVNCTYPSILTIQSISQCPVNTTHGSTKIIAFLLLPGFTN